MKTYILIALTSLLASLNFAYANPLICSEYFNPRNSSSLIILPKMPKASSRSRDTFRETIFLRQGQAQFAYRPLITEDYIGHSEMHVTPEGQHITLTLFSKGNIFHQQETKRQQSEQQLLREARRCKCIPSLPTIKKRNKSNLPSKASSLSPAQQSNIMKGYLADAFREQNLSQDSLDFLTRVGLEGNPEVLKQAYDYHEAQQAQPLQTRVRLSNKGLERYFYFTPTDMGSEVPARILDLHRSSDPYGFYILAEWTVKISKGQRTRHVGYLEVNEIQTIGNLTDSERIKVKKKFKETLSPNEIESLELARAHRLQTFGYTNFQRTEFDVYEFSDPLSSMNAITHMYVKESIRERFGRIDDMLNPEESRDSYNIFDIMTRYNARYILDRFESRQDLFEYAFVVTEDGQIKISPHGPHGNQLKTQALRLAHGRRIYAAGILTFSPQGHLNLKLEANAYHEAEAPRGRTFKAFQTEANGDLHNFLIQAFALQTGRTIESIDSYNVRTYAEYEWVDLGNGKGYFKDDFTTEDTASSSKSKKRSNSDRPNPKNAPATSADVYHLAAQTSWNSKDPLAQPLDFVKWTSELKISEDTGMDSLLKKLHAHYVLGTNPDMKLADIKTQYRKLAKRFHPDKTPFDGEAFKIVSTAYTLIEQGEKE